MQLSQNGLLRQCRKVLRTRDYKLYSLAQSSTISRVNFGPESGDGQNIDPSPETTPMDQPKMNKSFWSIVFANHNKHHETWAIIFNNQSPSLGKYLEVLLILSTVLFFCFRKQIDADICYVHWRFYTDSHSQIQRSMQFTATRHVA